MFTVLRKNKNNHCNKSEEAIRQKSLPTIVQFMYQHGYHRKASETIRLS